MNAMIFPRPSRPNGCVEFIEHVGLLPRRLQAAIKRAHRIRP